MKNVDKVEFKPGSKEELLPDFDAAFPCIATCTGLREGVSAPWHWHKAAELFYMESGSLEYITPSSQHLFPAGTGGFININVPHMTRAYNVTSSDRQLLHLFDPALIAGHPGSRIEQKYVLPLTSSAQAEIIALDPEDPRQAELLELLKGSFTLSEQDPGYELRIRSVLSQIWLGLLETARPQLESKAKTDKASDQIKQMMVYVHEHYAEKISISQLAGAACISERSCFELFRSRLHTSPLEYIQSYRLRMACRMLAQTDEPITAVGSACGLGSSSYFGKVFREQMGCTPLEYRRQSASGQNL